MTPTRIYQKAVAAALTTGGVSGIVHITGGGLIENPPRVFDNGGFVPARLFNGTVTACFLLDS